MVHIKKILKKKEWGVGMGGCVHAGMCMCSCRNTHRLGRSDCAEERKKSNGKSPDSSTKASGCPSFGNKHKSSMAALKKTQREDKTPHSPTLL